MAQPSHPTGRPDLRVHLALVAVQLFFGGFHVASKVALRSLSPLSLAASRVTFATPTLLGLAFHHDRLIPPARHLPHLALLGALGVFGNQLLYVLGLRHTTAINAAILIPSVPAFAAAVAAVARVERVSAGRLVGIGLAVAGSVVMLRPAEFSVSGGAAWGNLLVLLNCLSYAGFLVFQRSLHRHLPWRTIVAWAFLFGSLGVWAVGAPSLAATDLANVPTAAWVALAYIVVFPTVLGYGLNTWAVARSSPVLVAVYTTLQPIVSSGLALVMLGETFGLVELCGMAFILLGLLQVSRTPPG